MSSVLSSLGKWLYSISAVGRPNSGFLPEKVFFLSPEQHILELLVSNILFGGLLYVTLKRGKSKTSTTHVHPSKDVQQLTLVAKVMRFVLTICFFITIYHKYNGNKLTLMMMPCHFVTLCYLACLYAKKHSTGEFIFNVSTHYMFFTWLALLLPDHAGLTQFGEIHNFWVHHWILFIIPLYCVFTYHYKIDHTDHYYFKLAAALGGLVHFDMMGVAGLLSGQNVGYMLFPPPKTVYAGQFFRWGHAGFLVLMGWVSGYLLPWLVVKARQTINMALKTKY